MAEERADHVHALQVRLSLPNALSFSRKGERDINGPEATTPTGKEAWPGEAQASPFRTRPGQARPETGLAANVVPRWVSCVCARVVPSPPVGAGARALTHLNAVPSPENASTGEAWRLRHPVAWA